MAMLISFGLFACNNKAAEVPADEMEMSIEADQHQEHEHDHDGTEVLVLNDGQRWMVNQEMKPFVKKGEEMVQNYIKSDAKDYKALAAQLKEVNSQLIKSCTMDGKSHDELHKWLHPHLELVKELEQATDSNQADETVHELKDSYDTYSEYFN